MLTCHNLRCIRGEKLLFDRLGFSLQPGSALALTGPNGGGKTSLMRILSGLMEPAQGEVTWQGQPIRHNADYSEHLLYIGHQNAIKPELSVYDNVQYWAALQDCEMLVPAALEFFGLWPMADLPAGQLSAGWQRRVALTRLLSTPSLIWLLDEPATNLDVEGIMLVEGLIETRIKQGGIVILTSHSASPNAMIRYLHLEDFEGEYTVFDEAQIHAA